MSSPLQALGKKIHFNSEKEIYRPKKKLNKTTGVVTKSKFGLSQSIYLAINENIQSFLISIHWLHIISIQFIPIVNSYHSRFCNYVPIVPHICSLHEWHVYHNSHIHQDMKHTHRWHHWLSTVSSHQQKHTPWYTWCLSSSLATGTCSYTFTHNIFPNRNTFQPHTLNTLK